jgi:transcription elongation factor GreA
MARWDDLRRAILAKDTDGTERIWLELVEADPQDPTPFLEASDLAAKQPGGKRFASSLLGLLEDSFKKKEHWHGLLPIYGRISSYAPDEGAMREAVILAAQNAYPDRRDLETLLEKSQVRGGLASELKDQVESLQRLLQIEENAWVFHKSGWGVGQVVEYDPERGRCVIDFRTRPGHEMDVEAAAKLLERLQDDDIRVQAMSDPKGLRKRAKEEPLEMVKQVLARYNNSCPLRNIREALVPDAVATSTWSTWWKLAKKHALMDPRYEVGPGRDPRVEFHDIAQADFSSQVDRAIKTQATASGRQKAVRDLMAVVTGNDEAHEVLTQAVERELNITKDPAQRIGWVILHADLAGTDPMEGLAAALRASEDPVAVVEAIVEDGTRAEAARALVKHVDDGTTKLMSLALSDDSAAAEVAAVVFPKMGKPELVAELHKKIDQRPAGLPNLYAWYLKGVRRGRWGKEDYEAVPLVLRLLKVIDAVEYRTRRTGGDAKDKAKDKAAVPRLVEILTGRDCAMVLKAAKEADENSARHMVKMLAQNRGIKGRGLEKLQETILREHPTAMRVRKDEVVDEGPNQIYMTAAGMKRMREEANQIESVELPTNAAEIARAREFGDLKENAEYHAAREKQSMLQAKLDQLKGDLTRAVEIKPDIVEVNTVSVGCRVALRDVTGEEVTYVLLGPPDADVEKGIINYLTPLGQALMGQAQGDTFTLDIGGDVRELTVLKIENSLA